MRVPFPLPTVMDHPPTAEQWAAVRAWLKAVWDARIESQPVASQDHEHQKHMHQKHQEYRRQEYENLSRYI